MPNNGLQQAIQKALQKEQRTSTYSAYQEHVATILPTQYIFYVEAMGKPRMTQRDRWKVREVTTRYWQYKDRLNELALQLNFDPQTMLTNYYHMTFYLPMPKSWSETKRKELNGQLHRQKPDKDNLEKGFLDCLCKNDEFVADSRVTKRWCYEGEQRVEVVINL